VPRKKPSTAASRSTARGSFEYGYDKDNMKPSWIKDCFGNITRYKYDPQGRVVMIEDALGFKHKFGYTYEGFLEWHEKPNGHFTRYLYNASTGKPSQVFYNTTRDSSGSFRGGHFITYKYDELGALIECKSSHGRPTVYEYDKGHLVKETSPCGYVTTRLWDEKSRLKKITDSSGFYTEYSYDTFDRLITEKTPAGTSHWAYDACGRVMTAIDPRGHTTSYTYNKHGSLSSVKDALGNTTTYSYDNLNRLKEIVYAGGVSRKLSYDAMGACTQETYDKAM